MAVRVPILLYHSISNQAAPRYKEWTVPPADFAMHMAYLRDHGYTSMTVSDLVRTLANGDARLPERPVVVTFDDGFADFYTDALPILSRHDCTATLYVTTGSIGGTSRWLSAIGEGDRPMLTWRQLADVAASGIECGAHTVSHPQLDTLPRAAARDEIVRPKDELEQRLGLPVATFAYPHGYHGPAVRRLVQEAGYLSACGVKHAMSAANDDRFALARIIVRARGDGDMEHFAGLLAGRGLRVAPRREQLRTRGWRVARRYRARFEQRFQARRRLQA